MRLKLAAAAIAVVGVLVLLAAPADAAPKKKRVVVDSRGHTVFVSRDEDGRTRTRVIIQKRSYLDPGTERFPGENSEHGYAFAPNHHATGVLDRTPFGSDQTSLPTMWTLPFKNNPWVSY